MLQRRATEFTLPWSKRVNILALLCESDLDMIFPIEGEILQTDVTGCMDLLYTLTSHEQMLFGRSQQPLTRDAMGT